MTPDERRALADKILCDLNTRKTRATYGAVGCILGVPARAVYHYLGCRRPKASWVVRQDTEMPTGYKRWQLAEGLCHSPIIKSCSELREFLGLAAGQHGLGRARSLAPDRERHVIKSYCTLRKRLGCRR